MPGTQAQNLQDNLHIDAHIIHNLLHSNENRSCFDLLCDISQDRQFSGLRPLSSSILASDHTRAVHNKIWYRYLLSSYIKLDKEVALRPG